jgi:hypothetical protein
MEKGDAGRQRDEVSYSKEGGREVRVIMANINFNNPFSNLLFY